MDQKEPVVLNQDKYLHLAWTNPLYQDGLGQGAALLDRTRCSVIRQGVLAGRKLRMLAAYINRTIFNRPRKQFISSVQHFLRPLLNYCIQFWAPSAGKKWTN